MKYIKEIITRFQNRKGYLGAWLTMLPIVVMAAVVPILVRQVSTSMESLKKYPWYSDVEEYAEFFLAPKAFVLSCIMFLLALVVGARLLVEKKKIPFCRLLVPLAVYWLMAFVSSLLSVNRRFSFLGGYEQFESFLVISSYVLSVYYVFLYARTQLELRVVVDGVCFSASVIGILGTLQGLGIDYLAQPFVQRLVTSKDFFEKIGGSFTINFGDGTAYATLYNPNYLGVYGSFLVPFLAMLVLFDRSKWRKVWHGLNFVLVMIAMLSSRSRAGLISTAIALLLAAVICFRPIVKRWYLTLPAVNFIVVILLLVNSYNDDLIFGRLKQAFQKESEQAAEIVDVDGTAVKKTGLTELYTTKNGVILQYNEMRVQVSVYISEGLYGFYALNENGDQVELVGDELGTEFHFTEPALKELRIVPQVFYQPVQDTVEECLGFELYAGGEWDFVYNHFTEEYKYITNNHKASDIIMADAIGFENHQRMFSKRGYIWSRTIPLLKKHILVGSGPDTFLFEFPQNDYLMMKKYGFANAIMTKPHSMYLQMAVQTGMVSLLAFLVFYIWYAVQSIRLYFFRSLKTQAEGFGVATLIGSIGYMISGISNDSMVVTAPVFWIMLGVGIAANALVKKQRSNTPEETTAVVPQAEKPAEKAEKETV